MENTNVASPDARVTWVKSKTESYFLTNGPLTLLLCVNLLIPWETRSHYWKLFLVSEPYVVREAFKKKNVESVSMLIQQGFSSWQISSSEWKKNWEHQCALISHTMLSKTNTFNFYRKKSLNTFFWMTIFVFCRFLDQIRLQKTVFGLT